MTLAEEINKVLETPAWEIAANHGIDQVELLAEALAQARDAMTGLGNPTLEEMYIGGFLQGVQFQSNREASNETRTTNGL